MSPAPPFYTRYGFERTQEAERPLKLTPYPQLCHAGVLRATVIASAIDLVGGFFTRELAGTDATFTSDLSLRIPKPGMPASLTALGEQLRTGRRLISTAVRLDDDHDGSTYAYGETTFTRIPRQGDAGADLAALSTPLEIPSNPLDRDLAEEVGVEIENAHNGKVRLPLRPELLNPEGVMQGALVALLVEVAALTRASIETQEPQAVCELDLRYLAAASVGPVTGAAEWIGPPDACMLRVRLFDQGRDNRLTASALVRVTDAV